MIRILVIGLCLAMIACSTPAVEKPDPFIEQDKMVAILYDISILNAVSYSKKDYLKQRGIVPIETIYKWYGIDSLIFAQNDLYYASQAKVYKAIYKTVNDSLEAVKARYDEEVREELLKRKDSISKKAEPNDSIPQKNSSEIPVKRPPLKRN